MVDPSSRSLSSRSLSTRTLSTRSLSFDEIPLYNDVKEFDGNASSQSLLEKGPSKCLRSREKFAIAGAFLHCILVIFMMARETTHAIDNIHSDSRRIPSAPTRHLLEETPKDDPSVSSPQPVRVLVGILTMDSSGEALARTKFRELLALEPERACNLDHFVKNGPEKCQYIYTFVMGSATDDKAPTKLLNESERPFVIAPNRDSIGDDLENVDITHLNIK